ncbi:hypothetical protein CMESO_270 (nucleomorph) [Chroomonas mesostigmatica CCMP1168]|uniref:Uncharacterized protein n=1 Tax=Chroomonas mesostigmatica CCMP1168 TaxID=1195612 RepID=J7G1T7_9CRYP|nr:hypothetical protein CMESO_270 [Chroomonas mesostigmatica CCMP1168]
MRIIFFPKISTSYLDFSWITQNLCIFFILLLYLVSKYTPIIICQDNLIKKKNKKISVFNDGCNLTSICLPSIFLSFFILNHKKSKKKKKKNEQPYELTIHSQHVLFYELIVLSIGSLLRVKCMSKSTFTDFFLIFFGNLQLFLGNIFFIFFLELLGNGYFSAELSMIFFLTETVEMVFTQKKFTKLCLSCFYRNLKILIKKYFSYSTKFFSLKKKLL